MNKTLSDSANKILKSALIGQTGRIFLSSFLSVLGSVIFVFLALISKKIIDIATTHQQTNFTLLSICVVAIVLLQAVISGAVSHFKTSASGKIAVDIKKNLFCAVLNKNHNQINQYHSGDLLTRFSSDIDVVSNSLSSLTPSIASIIAKIVSGAIAILIIDWKFATAIIVLGVTVPFVCKLIGKKYSFLHKNYQQSESRLRSFLQENFKNLAIIKSFSSINPTNKKLAILQKENYDLKITRNTLNIIYSTGLSLFFTLGYFLVLLWGAKGIQTQTVTYGALIAFLQIISQIRAPLQSISSIAPAYFSMTASAERLAEIYDLEDEILPIHKDVFDAINDVFTFIDAKNLSFSYNDIPVLTDCSFQIKRGTVTVITGESGVGKSTLFRLLLGYLNANSSLKFDGKYDINSSTRAFFSYVPQGNMILSGTIRENLMLCCDKTSEEKINLALKTAVLNKWIDSLPEGLDTFIGEDGMGISQGQASRIALARALLCDTPILLLDEATAALDSETENELLLNLKALKDKTVILVTHRTLSENIYDNHLHLEGGKLINIKK